MTALRTAYWHTGERPCPDYPDDTFVNQFKVYRFASQFCRGKRVLDVGCGTGYGTAHLAETAKSAIGIDLSRQAVNYARRRYQSPRVQFFRMNAESLAFPDGSVDFIVSTENFEHLRDYRANLREMARVLTCDGMLLLATPNPEMFVGVTNPYHTKEFSYTELLEIVQEFFVECVISENLLEPPTEQGRWMREERQKLGTIGEHLARRPLLWGEQIDIASLSNTHSFFCFARLPRAAMNSKGAA